MGYETAHAQTTPANERRSVAVNRVGELSSGSLGTNARPRAIPGNRQTNPLHVISRKESDGYCDRPSHWLAAVVADSDLCHQFCHRALGFPSQALGRRPVALFQLGWGLVAGRAMRPRGVVPGLPGFDAASCLGKRSEPHCVQPLVAKATIEALAECVLHRLARLDVLNVDAADGFPPRVREAPSHRSVRSWRTACAAGRSSPTCRAAGTAPPTAHPLRPTSRYR